MTTPRECPFCGAEFTVERYSFAISHDDSCYFRTMLGITYSFIPFHIDAWNRRYTDAANVELANAMEGVLDNLSGNTIWTNKSQNAWWKARQAIKQLKTYTDAVATDACKVTKEVRE